jgi:lipopolysaccharide/colanic/teichoic acid biosynthesis glycosyltransferase
MKMIVKRILDIFIAFIALLLLLPFMLLISLCIFLTMGRPIFFIQKRPGLKGKPFKMYKFRTMTNETTEDNNLLPDKDRLTSFGRFLRSSSLDELPELLNVLRGEMSVTGPRPLAIEYLNRYSPEQARRHDVKPGITGWAQVNGRNLLSWEERFKMDIWYVDNWNLYIDLKIIVLTILLVIKREGVVPEGRSAMEDFMGSGQKDTHGKFHG